VKRLSFVVFALTFVLIVIGIQPLFAQVQGQWASSGTMQSARELNAQVLLSNRKVLSIGGIDNNGNLLASSELYNSTSGKWTLTGSMSNAREVFPAVVLSNGKVLVSGGLATGSIVLGVAELYDPTSGAWSSAGSLSVARFAHTATLLGNGTVLVTGGCTASDCSTDTAVSELYDPTSNSWSTTGNLNTARSYHTAVRLKTGKVLAIGGSTGLTSCELYDPTTGAWTNATSTNTGRYLNATTLLSDGKVLVTGGANGRYPISSAELYDPTANTWTLTGNMTTGRYAHTATLLSDGTVLVPGGVGQSISCGKDCTGYVPTSKVDIYDEAKGSFTAVASLSQPQAYQSTTLLKTGAILQDAGIGTTSTCCVVLNTSQIYTPLTLTFSASSLNFGLLQIGLTSPPQTVTVTNVSNRSVKFSGIAATGEFSQSHTCPTTLASGQNCTITVIFTPTVAGTQNSAVTLKDNCSGSPKQTIALAGTGETLALGFTPATLNLGSVLVGSSATQSATLTNDSSAAVNITGASISPANSTFAQTNNCPATLNVQQSCTFQITFMPPDVGTYNATLSVTNSAGAAATLSLTGTGTDN
jgi:centrosomal CEP192-like protein/galactose oxidase-like protein/Kelch motif protein